LISERIFVRKLIKSSLTIVDEMLESAGGAIVALEKVDVIRYSAGKSDV